MQHDSDKYQYVFIIGAARSGTKFMRDVLATANNVAVVPYDINYIWRHKNEHKPTDDLRVEELTYDIQQYIRKYVTKYALKNKQTRYRQDVDTIVEKTVSNTLRVPFCAEVFPNAKFIVLVRNGLDVTSSSLREWKKDVDWRYGVKKLRYLPLGQLKYLFTNFKLTNRLLDKKHSSAYQHWGPLTNDATTCVTEENIYKVCAQQWVDCVTKSLDDVESLPEERTLLVKYEDFVSNQDVRANLFSFSGVKDIPTAEAGFNSLYREQNSRWDQNLTSLQRKEILSIVDSTLAKFGYNQ